MLDARRCVAYLTVEHRGAIPNELEAGVGSMAAGCDICNEVCPWTRRAPVDLHPEFEPGAGRERPTLEDLEQLGDDGWRAWRAGSALTRIPWQALSRTLAIIRRNQGRLSAPPEEK